MLLFCKVVDKTQMSKPPEATRHPNSRKLSILLPLRAIQNPTLQYETPCRLVKKANRVGSFIIYYSFRVKIMPTFVLKKEPILKTPIIPKRWYASVFKLELSFCKKRQKSPNQETGLGNRGRLKVLKDTIFFSK